MKTTLKLPDSLLREIKVRAAQTDRPIKDVVTQLLMRGLKGTPPGSQPARLDLIQYIGKWPRYKNIDEVNAWIDELRQHRDVAG